MGVKGVGTSRALVDHCDRVRASRPRGPALLALVVLGRVHPDDVRHVGRRVSADLDRAYDNAEAEAIASRTDIEELMRNDLADSQLRNRRSRDVA